MKAAAAINGALSSWRPVQSAPDLAHDTFGSLDEDELMRLALRAYTEEIRAALRRKGADGVPLYSSITKQTPNGDLVRLYKQTELFTADDYRIAVASYSREARANLRVAQALAAQCLARLGVQIAIPGLAEQVAS